jgi:hypothetical protein
MRQEKFPFGIAGVARALACEQSFELVGRRLAGGNVGQERSAAPDDKVRPASSAPFAPAIARRLGNYVRRDGVDPRALLDYLSGFSKINNRDRFQRDAWEGEAQFDRVYRSSATAVAQRIAYLYPDATTPELCARYLKQFADLIATAREHGIRVIAIKLPLPALFRDRLPNEAAFDDAVQIVLTERAVPLRDLSAALDNPNFYFDTDHLNRAGVTESFQQLLKPLLMTPGRLTRTSMR